VTHAIWWDGNETESPRGKLDRLVKVRDQAANNAVYQKLDSKRKPR